MVLELRGLRTSTHGTAVPHSCTVGQRPRRPLGPRAVGTSAVLAPRGPYRRVGQFLSVHKTPLQRRDAKAPTEAPGPVPDVSAQIGGRSDLDTFAAIHALRTREHAGTIRRLADNPPQQDAARLSTHTAGAISNQPPEALPRSHSSPALRWFTFAAQKRKVNPIMNELDRVTDRVSSAPHEGGVTTPAARDTARVPQANGGRLRSRRRARFAV